MAEQPEVSSRLRYGDCSGCCYILEDDNPTDGDRRRSCGAELQPGSSYCAGHHALCHVAGGTAAEARRLREVEALARAVGGRRGNGGPEPSQRFLRKLEHAVRTFV